MQLLLSQTIQRGSGISFPFLGDWTINPPSYFLLFGRPVYFYGVIIAAGFLLAGWYCSKRADRFGYTEDDIYDVLIFLIPFSIIGARIYYVLFKLDYFLANPGEIIAVWNGGLAIYGGIIAGILVIILVCKHKKKSVLAMIDLICQGLLIGQIMGRWGNFMNREAFGRETDIFCRMGLTDELGNTIYVHPTFLYESLWNLIGFIIITRFVKKGRRKYDGQVACMYFLWYGLGRAWIEGLRTDSLYIGTTGIRVSQLLSVILIVFFGAVLLINARKTHTPDELLVNIVNGNDGAVVVGNPSEDIKTE